MFQISTFSIICLVCCLSPISATAHHKRFYFIYSFYSLQDYHVRELSILLSIPKLDLVKQFVLEGMHLVDGGVLKLFMDFALHSTASMGSGPNRLASIAEHKLKPDEANMLEVIVDLYATLQLSVFPRKIRLIISYVSSFLKEKL